MKISVRDVISAFSLSLDLANTTRSNFKNNSNTISGSTYKEHTFSIRANCNAFLALSIAYELKLAEPEIYNLYIAAMVHHLSYQNVFKGLHEPEWYLDENYLHNSVSIQYLTPLINVFDIIRYQHENFNGSGPLKLKGNSIPMASQILHLANIVGENFNFSKEPLAQGTYITDIVKQKSGLLLSPIVVDAFLRVANKECFWLNLYNIRFLNYSIDNLIPKKELYISLKEFEIISNVFAIIIDSKSSFTAEHSKEISSLAYDVACYLDYDEEKCLKMKIAGLLHDIGKLAIPTEILDKDGPLTEDEFSVIKSHPYYSKLILDKIHGIEDISLWASSHHEKLNGEGYPRHLDANSLTEECRIICACDIYQALTADRPYRKGMYMYEAFNLLDDMVYRNLICRNAVEALKSTLIHRVENEMKDIEK